MSWYPHVTVAAVVERDGRYLLVEERIEQGELVLNQPAGHLEEGETLAQAVIRETYEETGWRVQPQAFLSVHLYKAPLNQVSYLRINFVAKALNVDSNARLDGGIERALWLTPAEIQAHSSPMRSELVWAAIELHRTGVHYPLDVVNADVLLAPVKE